MTNFEAASTKSDAGRLLEPPRPSACENATIDRQSMTNHETRLRAAQPNHGGGDLVRLPKAPDGFLGDHPGHDFRVVTFRDKGRHRGFDHSRTDRVDADSLGGIVERGA